MPGKGRPFKKGGDPRQWRRGRPRPTPEALELQVLARSAGVDVISRLAFIARGRDDSLAIRAADILLRTSGIPIGAEAPAPDPPFMVNGVLMADGVGEPINIITALPSPEAIHADGQHKARPDTRCSLCAPKEQN